MWCEILYLYLELLSVIYHDNGETLYFSELDNTTCVRVISVLSQLPEYKNATMMVDPSISESQSKICMLL